MFDVNALDAPAIVSRDPVKTRQFKLLRFINENLDPALLGVEIGAFDRPILTPPTYNIRYADVHSTGTLRELAAMNPRRSVDKVVAVEFVIGEQTLAQQIDGRGVSYVFGSHVFEHIPNLLGFLRDMTRSLGPGGRLIGAFPDRRYTFDIDRPRTTLGQLLDRDFRQLVRPDPATVFDHFHNFRRITAGRVWVSGGGHGVPRAYTISQSLAQMQKSKENYIDVHCNVFTDDEFVEMIGEIALLGVGLTVIAVERTKRPGNEFLFCLEVNR